MIAPAIRVSRSARTTESEITVPNLKNFYEEFFSASVNQDLPRLSTLVDPSFIIHYDDSLPFGGTFQGVDGFFSVLGLLGATLKDISTETLNYMEDINGEQYSLTIRLTANIRRTGKPLDTIVSELWTVENGRAVEARIWYWGAANLFREYQRPLGIIDDYRSSAT